MSILGSLHDGSCCIASKARCNGILLVSVISPNTDKSAVSEMIETSDAFSSGMVDSRGVPTSKVSCGVGLERESAVEFTGKCHQLQARVACISN